MPEAWPKAGSEFSLIERYFAPLAGPEGLSLKDDCAHIMPPADERLILSKDVMIEGVHFPTAAPANLIAERSLGAALSDLAASAAKPFGYMVGLILNGDGASDWVAGFAEGLKSVQSEHGVTLLGGDTVRGDHVSISLTVLGSSPKPVTRAGAQVGDDVYVTGTLGTSAAILPYLLGKSLETDDQKNSLNQLKSRYWQPQPRFDCGDLLRDFANAAIDISDGLASDCRHICQASGVGVNLIAQDIPIDKRLSILVPNRDDQLKHALAGGDDYEILFTAPPKSRAAILDEASKMGLGIQKIGDIVEKTEYLIGFDGKITPLSDFPGFDHGDN